MGSIPAIDALKLILGGLQSHDNMGELIDMPNNNQDRIDELTQTLKTAGIRVEFDMPGEGFTMFIGDDAILNADLTPDLKTVALELETLTT